MGELTGKTRQCRNFRHKLACVAFRISICCTKVALIREDINFASSWNICHSQRHTSRIDVLTLTRRISRNVVS